MNHRFRTFIRCAFIAGACLALPVAASDAPAGGGSYTLDTAQLFTLFFITLGPLKLLGPFAQATRTLDGHALRMLAFKAAAIGFVALAAGGFVGRSLVANWMVPLGALQLTAGLIFFLVALQGVLAQYEAPAHPPEAAQAVPGPMKIAFPMLVTPYGVAAVILLLSLSGDAKRTAATLAMLVLVMVLNLLGMVFVRGIMQPSVVGVLQVLAAVLGVMQVALSITIMLVALRVLGVVGLPT
jgi:multiple antibiotic resistance protein